MKKLLTILLILVLSMGIIVIKNNSVQAEDNALYWGAVNPNEGSISTVPTGWSSTGYGTYMKYFNEGTTYATILKEWEGKLSRSGKVFVRWWPAADDTQLTSNQPFTAQWKDIEYLTFTAVEANSTVTFKWASADVDSVFYKKNDMADWAAYTKGDQITLTNVGDSVSFKGTNVTTDGNNHFSMTGKIAASGDVTSLTNGTGGNIGLSSNCYKAMFKDCTSLTTVPNLLSTTLAESCYYHMFEGCTGLTSVPVDLLPAATLAVDCYDGMFYGCTNLTNIPDLPAKALADSCYTGMFYNCSKIKVSETKTGNYLFSFKLTDSASATAPTYYMFTGTGGTYTGGTVTLGTQYYIETPSNPTNCNGATSCSISANEGDSNIVAHINNANLNKDSFYDLLKGGIELVYGKDYNLFDGSLIVSLNKSLVDTLGKGTHQIDVKYYDEDVEDYVLYHLNITIGGDSPTPAPSKPGDMPYDDVNGFKVEFNKGGASTATAHIAGATALDPVTVTSGGSSLTQGKDYTVEDGSIKVIFQPSFLNSLSAGTHVLNINVKNKDFKVTITVDGTSSEPVVKDESCEKVIGPTWHWNNTKGICEDYGVVGTYTR